MGGWFRRHQDLVAAGAVGLVVGFAIGLGSAHIGDGTVEWGTIGEWVGGLGAAGAVLWAVWQFRQERAAHKRQYADLVTVLPPAWANPPRDRWEDPSEWGDAGVKAHVAVANDGPASINQVVVYGELAGIPCWRAVLGSDRHMVGPGQRKGFELSWEPYLLEGAWHLRPHNVERLTVFFQDAALVWWSRGLGEPAKRLPDGPPVEVPSALMWADDIGQPGVL